MTHRDAVHYGLYDPEILAVRTFVQPVTNALGLRTRKRGNAVVALHPAERCVVSRLPEGVHRETRVLHLGFLEAQDVGPVGGQPVHHEVEAPAMELMFQVAILTGTLA